MSKTKLNLIAAACENMGIGIKGDLPWRLKKEMAYFSSMTSTVSNPEKKNVVIMGRVSWDCIPPKYRPLPNRVNIVLTRHVEEIKPKTAVIMGRVSWDCTPPKYRPLPNRVNIVLTRHVEEIKPKVPEGVVVMPGLDEAISYIEGRGDIESTWVIGGSAIYKAAMEHQNCNKIYLTEIQKHFDCDTFFPPIDKQLFTLTTESGVPTEKQTEGDISYYFRVYKKVDDRKFGTPIQV